MNTLTFRYTERFQEELSKRIAHDEHNCLVFGRCGEHRDHSHKLILAHKIDHTLTITNEGLPPDFIEHVSKTRKYRSGRIPWLIASDDLSSDTKRNLISALTAYSAAEGSPILFCSLTSNGITEAVLYENGHVLAADRLVRIGESIDIKICAKTTFETDEFDLRQRQAFGEQTSNLLRQLTIGVVGCSGTGSWVIEQLMRLGVNRLILVDPDKIEKKNLNRIVNSRSEDIGQPKVDIFTRAAQLLGRGTEVKGFPVDLDDRDACLALAKCDVLFGCVDSAKGREDLAAIGAFYCLPCIDIGMRLDPDGNGGVKAINGHMHYLIPGEFSLRDFGIYTNTQVHADTLKKSDPVAYAGEVRAGYIVGVNEDSPAVISLNGFVASLAVNELLFRLHPCRSIDPKEHRAVGVAISEMALFPQKPLAAEPSPYLAARVGLGDVTPLLDNPLLG